MIRILPGTVPANCRSGRMAKAGETQAERAPEGRGCGLISLILVLIALLAFAFAVWINAPSAAPEPEAVAAPETAPRP